MELIFDQGDDDTSLIARGDVDGLEWYLRRVAMPGREQLLFAATRHDDGNTGGCAGFLPLNGPEPLVAVEAADVVRFAWGVAPKGSALVQVVDEMGRRHEMAPDEERTMDGRGSFVLVLPADAIPRSVVFVDNAGAALAGVAALPRRQPDEERAARVESVASPTGVVELLTASGSLDDVTWTYELRRSGDDIVNRFATRGPRGGGAGGGGSGRAPQPGPARRVAVSGTGGGGGLWHLQGWVDPSVGELDLTLADGRVIRSRPFGDELELDVRFFAFCLRENERARMLEGFDSGGQLVDRCWLRSKVSTTESWLDDAQAKRRRAAQPVPSPVADLWREVTGQDMPPIVDVSNFRGSDATAGGERWPFEPTLTVAPELASTHGPVESRVFAHQVMNRYHRMVGFSLQTVIGSPPVAGLDTAEGAIVMSQGVWWSDPPGQRDEPNTTVRGHPAHFASYTAEVNNLESLELSWIEPATAVPEPFEGIGISLRCHPRHHSRETLFAIAESLVLSSP